MQPQEEEEEVEEIEAALRALPTIALSSSEPRRGREVCWSGCGRPSSVCVCAHLPSSPLPTSTTVVALVHPHELRHPLATAPFLPRLLRRCLLLPPARRLRPDLHPLLASLARDPAAPPRALFLFPGPPALDLAAFAADESNHPLPRVLIVFDGTWAHAREMVAASLPFLSRFAVRVSVGEVEEEGEGGSAFGSELVLRKEPFRGCVSTLEAVARALRVLEPDGVGAEVEERMLAVLRSMVGFQARHMKPVNPRPKLKKKKELNKIKRDQGGEVGG